MPTNPIPGLAPKAYYQAGVGLFQDTAGTTPAALNGDPVGLWQDQSGHGYHLTQATAAQRPTLVTNRFKGASAVNFSNASTQWLTNAAFPETQSKATGVWVIAAQIDAGCPSAALVSTTQDQLGILCQDLKLLAYLNSAAGQDSAAVPVTRQGVVVSLAYDGGQATDAAKLRLFRNLHQYALTISGPIAATTFAGGATLYMGRQAAGGYLLGRVVEAAFFTTLADADRVAVTNYLGATYFSRTTKDLIVHGDSRAFGASWTNNNTPPLTGADTYPLHARVTLGTSAWTMTNLSSNGLPWATISGSTPSAAELQDDWAAGQVIECFAGTNDFAAGTTVATVEGYVSTWVTAMHAAGFTHVYVGTQPRDNNSTSTSNIVPLNDWIRANSAGADRVVDFGADPRFLDSSSAVATNLTYYQSDATHFTDAGNAALASVLVPVVSLDFPLPQTGKARSFPRGLNRGLNRGVA